MNSGLFASGAGTEGLEQAGDSLGGFSLLESGLVDAKIKLAYIEIADSGAKAVAFHFEHGNNNQYRETIYFTNKQGQPFYERDGKKHPLPGFTTVNDIALLATGKDLESQTFEKQTHKLWSSKSQKEEPREVTVITSLLSQSVTLGIVKRIENKTKKNEQTNKYDPINEKRELNAIDKVFHTDSGKTVSEFKDGTANATFKAAWDGKNTGKTQDRYKEQSGQASAGSLLGGGSNSGGDGPKAKTSLFG